MSLPRRPMPDPLGMPGGTGAFWVTIEENYPDKLGDMSRYERDAFIDVGDYLEAAFRGALVIAVVSGATGAGATLAVLALRRRHLRRHPH